MIFPLSVPMPFNVVSTEEAEKAPPLPVQKTYIEVGPPGSDRIRYHTGRTEPTAMIWSSIPDGTERLVGILTPADLETIQKAWKS